MVVRVKSLEPQCNTKFACKIQKLESTSKGRRDHGGFRAVPSDIVEIPTIPRPQAEWEARTLADVSHGSIIGLKDWAIDDNFCLMVTEYAKGGTLETLWKNRGGKLDEDDARTVMLRLLMGLMNMHKHDISHRDIKLENLLVMEKDDVSSVKISDLGMAKQLVGPKGPLGDEHHSVCGSPLYMAPEMLSSLLKNETTGRTEAAYGMKVDVWSCGILLYILLSGERPFRANGFGQLFDCIKAGRYDFDRPAWNNVSKGAKDFVRHLLTVDSRQRPTSAEALLHPWLSKRPKKSSIEFTRSKTMCTAASYPPEDTGGSKKKGISKVMMKAWPFRKIL